MEEGKLPKRSLVAVSHFQLLRFPCVLKMKEKYRLCTWFVLFSHSNCKLYEIGKYLLNCLAHEDPVICIQKRFKIQSSDREILF